MAIPRLKARDNVINRCHPSRWIDLLANVRAGNTRIHRSQKEIDLLLHKLCQLHPQQLSGEALDSIYTCKIRFGILNR